VSFNCKLPTVVR